MINKKILKRKVRQEEPIIRVKVITNTKLGLKVAKVNQKADLVTTLGLLSCKTR